MRKILLSIIITALIGVPPAAATPSAPTVAPGHQNTDNESCHRLEDVRDGVRLTASWCDGDAEIAWCVDDRCGTAPVPDPTEYVNWCPYYIDCDLLCCIWTIVNWACGCCILDCSDDGEDPEA